MLCRNVSVTKLFLGFPLPEMESDKIPVHGVYCSITFYILCCVHSVRSTTVLLSV